MTLWGTSLQKESYYVFEKRNRENLFDCVLSSIKRSPFLVTGEILVENVFEFTVYQMTQPHKVSIFTSSNTYFFYISYFS